MAVALIPGLTLHASDYSQSFYTNLNTPFSSLDRVTSLEYQTSLKFINFTQPYLRNGSTSITGIENEEDNNQTALIRASVRSFSSCGFAWSRFKTVDQFIDENKSTWPNQSTLMSYKSITKVQETRLSNSYSLVDRNKIHTAFGSLYLYHFIKRIGNDSYI